VRQENAVRVDKETPPPAHIHAHTHARTHTHTHTHAHAHTDVGTHTRIPSLPTPAAFNQSAACRSVEMPRTRGVRSAGREAGVGDIGLRLGTGKPTHCVTRAIGGDKGQRDLLGKVLVGNLG
jgi:hypothetical protein